MTFAELQTAELQNRDTSAVHLWLVLWKASRALETTAHDSIRALNLGLSDFGVLEALLHKGPLSIGEIGGKVLLTSGSMTAAVDRLERKSLVERVAIERDRRVRKVQLTSQGRSLIRKAFAEHSRAMELAASELNDRERACLIDLLRRLGREARKQSGSEG